MKYVIYRIPRSDLEPAKVASYEHYDPKKPAPRFIEHFIELEKDAICVWSGAKDDRPNEIVAIYPLRHFFVKKEE